MEHIPCVVIGGGVVGLAIARCLSEYLETCVLEKERLTATQTSARNSGVIHAGIYYPEHYLKSVFCLAGKHLLYRYCQDNHIHYQKTGKLIVANSEEEQLALEQLQHTAHKNGVFLNFLERPMIRELEPQLRAAKALYSEESGIVDSYQLCQQLAYDVLENGSYITTQQQVTAARREGDEFIVEINHNDRVSCHYLINAAGLEAQAIAKMLGCHNIPPLYLCKGQYFSYQGPSPFSHLIYPLPMKNNQGLGIHATLDLAGQCRFGPDSEYIDEHDYSNNDSKKMQFLQAIKHYFPSVEEQRLQVDYTGIRPKLAGPNQAMQDFAIHNHTHHGVDNLINLYGIESPGLTSCMSIANYVTRQLGLQ